MKIRSVIFHSNRGVTIYTKDEKERIPEKSIIMSLDGWATYSAIMWAGGLFLGGIIGFLIGILAGAI